LSWAIAAALETAIKAAANNSFFMLTSSEWNMGTLRWQFSTERRLHSFYYESSPCERPLVVHVALSNTQLKRRVFRSQ
jgi:hypothetical protein